MGGVGGWRGGEREGELEEKKKKKEWSGKIQDCTGNGRYEFQKKSHLIL